MKSLALISLLFGLLAFNGPAYAEGGCPSGMIPYSGTDINSCGPIPPGYYQQQSSQVPTAPAPRWESRWGAIATDAPKGVIGSSNDALTENDAKAKAIADCKYKGGATCALKSTFSNGCGALLVGDKGFNVNSGATEEIAIQKAMDVCKASSTGCHVYFTTCSPSVRTQ